MVAELRSEMDELKNRLEKRDRINEDMTNDLRVMFENAIDKVQKEAEVMVQGQT